ncbi:PREDICTED: acetylcholinesterase-like [Dufourea novaeangliae]|uniref:acetylcholinesterase-like n=1 Tax=Dufourea novaeangliae TaxID=178035 RepID=UPI00076736FF|nr:PREDICTED: acetylcholinesterase-like [Dufourea novaeangliae]
MDELPQSLVLPFRPTAEIPSDHAFLTSCPISLFESGNFSRVPIMLGLTKHEALGFDRPAGNTDQWTKTDDLLEIDQDVFNRFYRGKVTDFSVFLTDWYYTAPVDLTRKLIQNQIGHKSVYYYIQNYDSPYALHRQLGTALNGTAHADDVQYVFYMRVFREPSDPNDPINQFRKMVSAMWANFAKFGNPTPRHNNPSNVIWQESGDCGLQLNINSQCRMQDRDVSPIAAQYEQYISETLPLKTCRSTSPVEVIIR